ncbi:hypothetical protein KEJ50_04265 [Candidatus Bathyarchaeota archaeon]|nr:hypothetical protein [Candidatus Bathyarchaeota archaeon]
MSKKCVICFNEVEENEDFCELHKLAYLNIIKAYSEWKKAYGEVSFKDFLEKIIEAKESGEAVKEVAFYMTKNHSKINVGEEM